MKASSHKDPLDALVLEARVAAGTAWGDADFAIARSILRRCAVVIEGLRREARGYAESLDNIRAALGQEATHHLVMADGVEELVKAMELCADDGGCRAMTVLRKLRERGKPCRE